MKSFSFLFLFLFLSGCGTTGAGYYKDMALAQKLLTKICPPDFSGPIDTMLATPWFTGSLRAGGVKKGPSGFWTFTWFAAEGQGHIIGTRNHIRLGEIPPPPETAAMAREYTRGYEDALERLGKKP